MQNIDTYATQLSLDITPSQDDIERQEIEYEEQRLQDSLEDNRPFVPEDDVDKHYVVVCENGEDWKCIHDLLVCCDTHEEHIPCRECGCSNESKSCPRIGTFLLSDAEAEELRKHPKVSSVEYDREYYTGTFQGIHERPYSQVNRYPSNVKIGRDLSTTNFFLTNPDSSFANRTGASIYRHSAELTQWTTSDDTIIEDIPKYRGDGSGVDVIVCDESGWYGHIEFIDTNDNNQPPAYVGGNVLNTNFAPSCTNGVCGVLDLVLDSPYYLDPDFFEADPANRLMTRWDGTTVPVESVARNWWGIESTTYRSAKFVSTDLGGTAVIGSPEDFGTISVSTSYTRARMNGSNTAQHTNGGFHATPCMSQAYGKTQGWAFNANKWHTSIIWGTGAVSITSNYRMQKVFHTVKPNHPLYGTKNPTVSSNSWGSGYSMSGSMYYYWRTPGDGTGGVSFDTNTKPAFLNNMINGNRVDMWYDPSDSEQAAGMELVDSGVFYFSAAGNNNQCQVDPTHPNYNNYWGTTSTYTLASAELNKKITNRPGHPACIGLIRNFNNTGFDTYRSFCIGALDDNLNSTSSERKAYYSNWGSAMDCYTIGDESLSATDTNTSTRYNRYDSTYTINGVVSLACQDRSFGGTSSACPVTAGLAATKLQWNRDWDWYDLKHWFRESITKQTTNAFYSSQTDPTSPTDTRWNTQYGIGDSRRTVIFDYPTANDGVIPPITGQLQQLELNFEGGDGLSLNNVSISFT